MGWDKRETCEMNSQFVILQWFFSPHLFCMRKRQWLLSTDDDRKDSYRFYGLFIYFFVVVLLLPRLFLTFTHWSTPSTWKNWWKQIDDDDDSGRKIESSWASITLAALHMCSLFAVTVKERKKAKREASLLFRRLCFPSWVPVIYTSFFLIACLLSPIAVAAFLLLLCSFAIRSTLSSRLPCFFLLFNWEAHRAHNARFVDFTSLVELCINVSCQNKR